MGWINRRSTGFRMLWETNWCASSGLKGLSSGEWPSRTASENGERAQFGGGCYPAFRWGCSVFVTLLFLLMWSFSSFIFFLTFSVSTTVMLSCASFTRGSELRCFSHKRTPAANYYARFDYSCFQIANQNSIFRPISEVPKVTDFTSPPLSPDCRQAGRQSPAATSMANWY